MVRDTLAGAVATGLLQPDDQVVSLYHRRLEHGGALGRHPSSNEQAPLVAMSTRHQSFAETVASCTRSLRLAVLASTLTTRARAAPAGYPTPSLGRDAALARALPWLQRRGIWSRGRFGSYKVRRLSRNRAPPRSVTHTASTWHASKPRRVAHTQLGACHRHPTPAGGRRPALHHPTPAPPRHRPPCPNRTYTAV